MLDLGRRRRPRKKGGVGVEACERYLDQFINSIYEIWMLTMMMLMDGGMAG